MGAKTIMLKILILAKIRLKRSEKTKRSSRRQRVKSYTILFGNFLFVKNNILFKRDWILESKDSQLRAFFIECIKK